MQHTAMGSSVVSLQAVLTNLRDKLPVFSVSDWAGGVTGIMLPLGFLCIVSVVLGVRNRRCQPKYKAAGWLAAPQHVFLHSDTVFFAPGMCIPHRALGKGWSCSMTMFCCRW